MATLASIYYAHFQSIIPSRPRCDFPEEPKFYHDFTRFSRAVFYDADPAEEIDIIFGQEEQRGPFDDAHDIENRAENKKEDAEEDKPSIEEVQSTPVRPVRRGGKQMIRMVEPDSSSDSDSDSDDEDDSDDDEAAPVARAPVQAVTEASSPVDLKIKNIVEASAPVIVADPIVALAPVTAATETRKKPAAAKRVPQKKNKEEPTEESKKPAVPVNPAKKPRQPKEKPEKKVTKKPAAPRKPAVSRRGKKSFDPLPTAASFSSGAFDPRMCAVAPIRRRGSETTLKRSATEGISAMAMEKKMKMGGF